MYSMEPKLQHDLSRCVCSYLFEAIRNILDTYETLYSRIMYQKVILVFYFHTFSVVNISETSKTLKCTRKWTHKQKPRSPHYHEQIINDNITNTHHFMPTLTRKNAKNGQMQYKYPWFCVFMRLRYKGTEN